MMDGETRFKLDAIHDDITWIKAALSGEGDKAGLIIDVDRLKRSRATTIAILWLAFTTVIGLGATAIGATFLSNH